jgi:Kef-type K+ transport system membrane component KefB
MVNSPEQLLLELFVVFVSAKAVGEIFERVSLPSVVGEILSGVILGPYAFGLIPTNGTIQSVAELGAIFVLVNADYRRAPPS